MLLFLSVGLNLVLFWVFLLTSNEMSATFVWEGTFKNVFIFEISVSISKFIICRKCLKHSVGE